MTVTEPQHNKVLIHASGLFADTKLLLFCAEESQSGADGADLMRGMSWMVQQVLGKPGRGSSSVHVTLYDLQQRHRVQCPRFNKQKMLADDEFFL